MKKSISKAIIGVMLLASIALVGCDGTTTGTYKGGNSYTTRYEYKNKTTTRYKSDGNVKDLDKNGKVDNKEWEKQWNDYLDKQYDKYGV